MTSWTFGSTALSDIGTIQLINDYLDIPEKRGENIIIPFRHGSIITPKYYSERKLTFGMTVVGTSMTNLESKIDTLKTAVQGVKTLTQTMNDATTRTATAEVNRSLMIQRLSPTIARITIEFSLPKAVLRGSAIANNETTINASPKAMSVVNTGTVEERDANIILTGPLSNVTITNSTNGNTLTYTGTIASPRVVTISTSSTGQFVATTDLGVNVIGNVTHTGASAMMVFDVGTNTLSVVSGTTTTGKVKVTFNAPYL